MAFKFPFTNYHELNLTWVLEQLKKLFEDSAENVETIESYEDRLSAVETELPTVEATATQSETTANAAATLAQTAKTTADTANENALTASAQASLARQEAATAEAEAQAATQAAQQAQATVQDFDGRITQAEDDASEALQEAQSFNNRVNAAINTANNAANTATIAQGIAVNANQNAAAALDTAQAAELDAVAAMDKADTNADNIGDLSELTTTAKSDLVSAINEAAASGGAVDSVNGKTGDVVLNAGDIEIIPGLVYSNGTTGKAVNTLAASVAPVESSGTASRAYFVGELLIYNYQLYKVVSPIAVGASLTPGTNITETTVKTEIVNGGSGTDLSLVNFGNLPMAVNRILFGPPSEITGRNYHVKTYYNAVDVIERTGVQQTAVVVLTGTPRIVSSSSSAPFFTPIDSDYSNINMQILRLLLNIKSITQNEYWGFYKASTVSLNNGCYFVAVARYKKSDDTYITRSVNFLLSSFGSAMKSDIVDLIKNSITVDDETLYCDSICLALRIYLPYPAYIGINLFNE